MSGRTAYNVSMRKILGLLLGIGVLGAVIFGLSPRYIPAIPQIEPPPQMENDEGGFLDDTLLNPYPVGEKDPLDLFNEPSLWDTSSGHAETYRMILMPTFDHPVLVKAWRDNDGPKLVTKFLIGKGGYDKGKLFRTDRRDLTEDEWNSLIHTLDTANFWFAPAVRKGDDPVTDGAQWWLQGRSDGNIYSIFRITPKGQELDSFLFFLDLAGQRNAYQGYW